MAKVVVSCGSRRAALAGVHIGEVGGNAIDAALAAALVAMATTPGMVGLDAAGFVNVWPSQGDPRIIDGYTVMPGKGLPATAFGSGGIDIEMDYGGYTRTIVGYGSVGVSGGIAAFDTAHRRWGTVPWGVLFEPVIDHVRTGFELPGSSAAYLRSSHDVVFGWLDHSRLFLNHEDGTPLQAGDIVRMPDLVGSLQALAEQGAGTLYGGDLGRTLSTGVRNGGGILTIEDLATYDVVDRAPIRTTVSGWHVATNPPPAVGGSVLAALLVLADVESDAAPRDPMARWVDAQNRVLAFRSANLDNTDNREAAVATMLEAASIRDLGVLSGPPSTVHVSVVDDTGTACSITVSSGYGAGAMVEGTGIWLNNALGELELTGGTFHGLEPGERLMSNMSPTIARHPGGEVLAVGSGGADRITTAIGSVLYGYFNLGLDLEAAVLAPRSHVENYRGERVVSHETGFPLPSTAVPELGRRDLGAEQMFFGGVHIASRSASGTLFGVGDPRRSGATAIGGSGAK